MIHQNFFKTTLVGRVHRQQTDRAIGPELAVSEPSGVHLSFIEGKIISSITTFILVQWVKEEISIRQKDHGHCPHRQIDSRRDPIQVLLHNQNYEDYKGFLP